MAKLNLYSGELPFMVTSGTFGRCRHGHTLAVRCWRCGIWHPIKFLANVWQDVRIGTLT
jgi:hypothetical protein